MHSSRENHNLIDQKHQIQPCAIRMTISSRQQKTRQSFVLCGFHGLLGMLLDFLVVPGAGLEPARLAAGDFESPASTNFATRARKFRCRSIEARHPIVNIIVLVSVAKPCRTAVSYSDRSVRPRCRPPVWSVVQPPVRSGSAMAGGGQLASRPLPAVRHRSPARIHRAAGCYRPGYAPATRRPAGAERSRTFW